MTTPIKLNLGCGADYRAGYLNVDSTRILKVDLVADLSVRPWPFPDNYADEIVMQDALEHLPDPHNNVVEVHRILKAGGIFRCHVPYAKCDGAFQSPEHKSFFTEKSMDYFCGISGYDSFTSGTPMFTMLSCRLDVCKHGWRNQVRNLIPFRPLLRHFLWNMYDGVDFVMRKS